MQVKVMWMPLRKVNAVSKMFGREAVFDRSGNVNNWVYRPVNYDSSGSNEAERVFSFILDETSVSMSASTVLRLGHDSLIFQI